MNCQVQRLDFPQEFCVMEYFTSDLGWFQPNCQFHILGVLEWI